MSLEEVELRHAQRDMGRMAIRIYRGAREEGDRADAFWATVAAIYVMVTSARNEEEE